MTAVETETGALARALDWITQVMLGSVATSAAVLAIAGLGAMMMAGRVPVRRGAEVMIGCFILSGARPIAAGLVSLAAPVPFAPSPSPSFSPLADPDAYRSSPVPDPYAGAAVPSMAAPLRSRQSQLEPREGVK